MDTLKQLYKYFMNIVIVLSLLPLCFAEQSITLIIIDYITVIIFICDYVGRWYSYVKEHNMGKAFFLYPFLPMSMIDLLTIVLSLTAVNKVFKTFCILRLFRYSMNIQLLAKVVRRKKDQLFRVCSLALGYILISALIAFQVEPKTFGTIFNAIYWVTVSLTTVGYGDIYPVTETGKIISMLSSFFGIAIVALPSGIITSGCAEELKN